MRLTLYYYQHWPCTSLHANLRLRTYSLRSGTCTKPSERHCALVNGTERLCESLGGYVMKMSPEMGSGGDALGNPNGNVGL